MDAPTKQHFHPRQVETRSYIKHPYASYKIRDPLEYAERVETERRHDAEVMTAAEWQAANVDELKTKASLPHGQWLPWLKHEFGWSRQHADNLVSVASKLPNFSNLNFQPSALYLLAQDSTPDAAREEAGCMRQNQCAEIKLRAERKGGELLAKTDRHKKKDGRPKKVGHDVTLNDIGVTRKQAERWQAVASVPEKQFEQHVKEVRSNGQDRQAGKAKIPTRCQVKRCWAFREAIRTLAVDRVCTGKSPP